MANKPWTKADMALLAQVYPKLGPDGAAETLGRTKAAVVNKFTRTPGIRPFVPMWTTKEIAVLKQVWETGGSVQAAKLLPGRTAEACARQAIKLGLRRGESWRQARRPQPNAVPPEKAELIGLARKRGFKVMDIAQTMGVSKATVWRHAKKY